LRLRIDQDAQLDVDFVQQAPGLAVGRFNLERLTKDVSGLGIVSLLDQLLTLLDQLCYGCGLKTLANRIQFEQQIFHGLVPIRRGLL
jgi:hypothetical protein